MSACDGPAACNSPGVVEVTRAAGRRLRPRLSCRRPLRHNAEKETPYRRSTMRSCTGSRLHPISRMNHAAIGSGCDGHDRHLDPRVGTREIDDNRRRVGKSRLQNVR